MGFFRESHFFMLSFESEYGRITWKKPYGSVIIVGTKKGMLNILVLMTFITFLFSAEYGLPTNTTRRITGTFGECRITSNTYVKRLNIGIAISTNSMENTNIYAMNDGVVWKLILNDPSYGNIIYIKHPDGLSTMYAHLNRFSSKFDAILQSVMVEFGEESNTEIEFNSNEYTVRKGDIIGYSGKTGTALAPYCHVEFLDYQQGIYIDPLVYLKDLLDRPDADLEIIKVRVDGKEQNISNGGTYFYRNQYPEIEINARLADNSWNSRYGVHRVQLFFDETEVYQLLFETIPEEYYEQGDLVYGEGSTSSYYWYKLFSNKTGGAVVLNRLSEVSLSKSTKARIVVEDDWGNAKTWSFYLKQE